VRATLGGGLLRVLVGTGHAFGAPTSVFAAGGTASFGSRARHRHERISHRARTSEHYGRLPPTHVRVLADLHARRRPPLDWIVISRRSRGQAMDMRVVLVPAWPFQVPSGLRPLKGSFVLVVVFGLSYSARNFRGGEEYVTVRFFVRSRAVRNCSGRAETEQGMRGQPKPIRLPLLPR
jgi:hypothetical protein